METIEQQDLFVSGEEGYARYRIPALLSTPSSTVLAFCEARKFTGKDSDQIDLYVRRSIDGGRTWSPRSLVATELGWVCGNPAPVYDSETGTIWLLFCKNLEDGDETAICEGRAPRTVWVTSSENDGRKWSSPVEITSSVKPAEWSWYATGPCHGIQLRTGRLLIPCDHIVLADKNRQDPYHSHIVYSDDHGASWRIGGIADEGTNESTVLETMDGTVYLNCRNKYRLDGGGNFRSVTFSEDGGLTFAPTVHDAGLPEPICQGSVCRLSGLRMGERPRVLFSNPGSTSGRTHLTVRLSYDECKSWPVARTIHAKAAAYSDLAVAADGSILCLYERGEESPYDRITLARFNLEWLTSGADTLSRK